jgi:hypothetical protein
MINLTTAGKALLNVLCAIVFNILMDIWVFQREMTSHNIGGAILCGIGTGFALYFLFYRKRNTNINYSSSMSSKAV